LNGRLSNTHKPPELQLHLLGCPAHLRRWLGKMRGKPMEKTFSYGMNTIKIREII